MHVHLNGLHIHQYQNITLRLTPHVDSIEAFWDSKKNGHALFTGKIEEIHMPNNSGCTIYYELYLLRLGILIRI